MLLVPGSDIAEYYYFRHQDKVAHVALFSVWSLLLYMVFEWKEVASVVSVLLFGIAVAGVTEWVQGYVPYRSSDLNDFLFDMAGIIIGLFFAYFIKKELLPAGKKFDK